MDRHDTDSHSEANTLGDLRPDTDTPNPSATLRAQSLRIGVLAFGSLIDNPGSELGNATVNWVRVTTPFHVEFARQSTRRGGAPTLIPVESGGAVVPAKVLILDTAVSVFSAADMLYRREINKAGTDLRYDPKPTRERDDIVIELLKDFGSCDLVLYTKIGANIEPLTANHLADLAIASAKKEAVAENRRDGISYLISAKDNAIYTPLSQEYVAEILAKTNTLDLVAAWTACRKASSQSD